MASHTLLVRNSVKIAEITLSQTVSKINAFLCLKHKFKIASKTGRKLVLKYMCFCVLRRISKWPPKWWKMIFSKKGQMTVLIPWSGGKYFVKVTLSLTVSETNAFLHFTQKFKMAPKTEIRRIVWQRCHMTLHLPCG